MRLQFRHRINLLVALAAMALLVVTTVTLVLGRSSERRLVGIETRYVPLIELNGDLKRMFADIARTLEDAASAGEPSKIEEADRASTEFRTRVANGAQIIVDNGGDPKALAAAFDAYYSVARQVSSALAQGVEFAEVGAQIEAMRRAQRALNGALDQATTPDRTKLAAAFARARQAHATAFWVHIAVAATVLALMALLSVRIIRRTVRSLEAVSAGVERFATGELGKPIDVPAGDELGDLAAQANRTAAQLREYREQTTALLRATETANKELEAFSYSVSHDLRAPLRSIDGFSAALVEDDGDRLSDDGRAHLERIRAGVKRMTELIDDLLRLSRVSRGDFVVAPVDLSKLAETVAAALAAADPERRVELVIAPAVTARADARLARIVLENLLGNAWKFTSKVDAARVEFGEANGAYFVRDNGAGFDMNAAEKLFGPFQRLHSNKEFPGTGIGLATVQRIVHRHGGRIWAEAEPGRGATFYFTFA